MAGAAKMPAAAPTDALPKKSRLFILKIPLRTRGSEIKLQEQLALQTSLLLIICNS